MQFSNTTQACMYKLKQKRLFRSPFQKLVNAGTSKKKLLLVTDYIQFLPLISQSSFKILIDLPVPEAWWIQFWGFSAGVCVCHIPDSQATSVVLQEPLFPKTLIGKKNPKQPNPKIYQALRGLCAKKEPM